MNSERHVDYLRLGRFIAGEPTLRFKTNFPLSNADQRDLRNSVRGSIDVFVEAEEE